MSAFDEAVDWDALRDELVGSLREEAGYLLEGAAEDVELFLQRIAQDQVLAMRAGRDDLCREMRGQIKAIAELNRLRAADGAWSSFEKILDRATSIALPLIRAATKALTGI